jgi:ABC-2 type transport system ATP-binding protein
MASIIAAENLSKRYGQRVGIDGVRLDVPEGQIFGFLGPNGAGKTTTIRLLLGLVHPTSGTASVMGLDCWQQSHRIKREVGYVPGDLRLYSWMTLDRALRVFGRIRGQDLRRSGREFAERFQLETNLHVRKMSRGMRQKVGLVLAMAHRPRLLILDEPTSGLDPLMQDELGRILREFARQGRTVFFSSHTLSEVEQLCDRVAIVRSGRIVADEMLATLRHRAARSVLLYFSDEAAAEITVVPEFLRRTVRDGVIWKCELTGPAQPLVQWAAQQPISDLEIGKPELESVFRSFYHSGETTS